MPRLLNDAERALYARFGEMLRDDDRRAFCQQIMQAKSERHEPSYTYFTETAGAPAFATSPYPNELSWAYYDDVDGQPVHVILHFARGYISWIERFRIDTSRLTHGRSRARVELVIPAADDLRFVAEACQRRPTCDSL